MAILTQPTDGGCTDEDLDELASSVKFQPGDRTATPPDIDLPDELWLTVLESACTFTPVLFHEVMSNLIKNPNITSSHLFRADIYYDSGQSDGGHIANGGRHGLLKHLKAEYRPLDTKLPDYQLTRTIVRQMIPRNPQLDRPLVQTCHFFQRLEEDEETKVVMYIPHVRQPEDMPFYHPAVSKLAFVHRWRHVSGPKPSQLGSISVSYCLFPSTTISTKLERTALRLLQTVHKHGQGQLAGYEKRVHLDQIIPQKRYQDIYAQMKTKYGRQLVEDWVEVTDPGKHVFEDIAIAAFLVALWRDMYASPWHTTEIDAEDGKPTFPGFVDIGCGNGILTYLLLSEGFSGWGFDARRRKTWSTFPEHVEAKLEQRLLVPEILHDRSDGPGNHSWHNGVFREGSFIISNHADELTLWTPLLAYINKSSFIAIPCCSHDLSGARFRAPPLTQSAKERTKLPPEQQAMGGAVRLPQQVRPPTPPAVNCVSKTDALPKIHAAESGSLARTLVQKKMASAYSTLCSYVGSLAEEVGFESEKEVLRIPSTRNTCIIGRRRARDTINDVTTRRREMIELVQREMGRSIDAIGNEWIARAEKLAIKPGSGH